MSAIVAIPARMESSRFPGKILADLQGKPMLWHVCDGVAKAKTIGEIWVVTDSLEILEQSRSWGVKACLSSKDCHSGTDRIASVMDKLDADIIVNVQGDEPLITGEVIDSLVDALHQSKSDVTTPVYRITNAEEIANSNVVKVVRSLDGTALYFSRSPIPHVRDIDPEQWQSSTDYWGHTGVYGYRRQVLKDYPHMPIGELEQMEKLEQLRILESGRTILAVEINYRPQAVDVPADLERVAAIMKAKDNPR